MVRGWSWLSLPEEYGNHHAEASCARRSHEPETQVCGRSGFLQDQFVDSEGSNNSHTRAFAQDVLRDRIMRPLRQPEFQNGIDDLVAGRNGQIHGEASIDDRVNAKRDIGKTRGEIP